MTSIDRILIGPRPFFPFEGFWQTFGSAQVGPERILTRNGGLLNL